MTKNLRHEDDVKVLKNEFYKNWCSQSMNAFVIDVKKEE